MRRRISCLARSALEGATRSARPLRRGCAVCHACVVVHVHLARSIVQSEGIRIRGTLLKLRVATIGLDQDQDEYGCGGIRRLQLPASRYRCMSRAMQAGAMHGGAAAVGFDSRLDHEQLAIAQLAGAEAGLETTASGSREQLRVLLCRILSFFTLDRRACVSGEFEGKRTSGWTGRDGSEAIAARRPSWHWQPEPV